MADFDVFQIPESRPKTDIKDYITFIYAPPKFGKSTLGSMFGASPLFLGFEVGYNALYGVRPVAIPDWKWFVKNIVDSLEDGFQKGKTIPYDVIVVDTADKASAMCKTKILKDEGIQHESDLEWGKGYAYIKEEFEKQFTRLTKLGIGVVFISHAELKEFKPKGKEPYNKIVTSLPKGAREVLLNMSDFIIYGNIEVEQTENGSVERRYLNMRETAEYEAGSRLRFMPNRVSMGDSAEEGYDNFLNAFNEAVEKEFHTKGIARRRQAEFIPSESPAPVVEGTSTVKDDKKKPSTKKVADEKKVEGTTPSTDEKKVVTAEPAKVVEEKKETPKDTPKTDTTGKSLEDLKKELDVEFNRIYKSGAKSPVELVALIKDTIGKAKLSEIDNVEEAVKLLDVAKGVESSK